MVPRGSHAAGASDVMAFTAKGEDCDDPVQPTVCTVPLGAAFLLSVSIIDAPDAGYTALQSKIDYGSLVYTPRPVAEEDFWPSGFFVRTPSSPTGTEGVVAHTGVNFSTTFYTGKIVEIILTCSATLGSFVINMIPYSAGDTFGAGFKVGASNVPAKTAPLTVNCGAPLTVEGGGTLEGGVLYVLADERLHWLCDPENPSQDVVIRMFYPWGSQDIAGTGATYLTVDMPLDLERVECIAVPGGGEGAAGSEVLYGQDTQSVAPNIQGQVKYIGLNVSLANVQLEYLNGMTWVVPGASDPLFLSPAENPGEASWSGGFGWNVASGTYRVRVTKTGCTENLSVQFQPPEEVELAIACPDTDGDTIPDYGETGAAGGTGTSPSNPDSDGDTIPDGQDDCDLDSFSNLAEVQLGSIPCYPENLESDLDGCNNLEELGFNEEAGGRRNPSNPYDFYDTDGNKLIDLFIDIFGVAGLFGADADSLPPGEPDGYDATYDRSAPIGSDPWDMGAPDGLIDLFIDIFGVAFQFGHSCEAPP